MNHFQLFLNASTQTIFIVYASLSVLHVSHVSTFLQCRQHSRGRADSRSTIEKKILSLLPGEHPRKGTGIPRAQLISCTRRSSCLLWRWCSDPAISILVLNSLRCRYESAPTCAVGYFRCRLSASSTQSYIQTEVCLLVQPDSTQDPALLHRERWMEAEGKRPLSSLDAVSHSSHLNYLFQRVPFTCPNSSAHF